MRITVTCGQCGAKLRAKPEHAGKHAKCPKCGTVCEIPVQPEQKGQGVGDVNAAPSTPTFEQAVSEWLAPAGPPGRVCPEQKGQGVGDVNPALSTPTFEQAVSQGTAPAGPPSPVCPECGIALSANAVICVQCGMDFRTGKRLATHGPADVAVEPAMQNRIAGDAAQPDTTGNLVVVRLSDIRQLTFPNMCIRCLSPNPKDHLALTFIGDVEQHTTKDTSGSSSGELMGAFAGLALGGVGGEVMGAVLGKAFGLQFDGTTTEVVGVKGIAPIPVCSRCVHQLSVTDRNAFADGARATSCFMKRSYLSKKIREGHVFLTFANSTYAQALREMNTGRAFSSLEESESASRAAAKR